MKRACVFALVLSGCFSKPPYREQEDASACAVSTTPGMAISGNRVTWANLPASPFIELGEDTTGVPMPTQLSLSGTNILPPPNTECTFEDRMGIALFPLFQATGGAAGFTGISLDKLVTGPAYTSWVVHWTHALTCDVNSEARGETRFSMFPDGRISRVDIVNPSPTAAVTVMACTKCFSTDEGIVTTFTAFDRDQLTAVQRLPASQEQPIPVDLDEPPGASEGGCIVDTNRARMTVLWDQRMPAGPETTRFRAVTSPAVGPLVVFVADLFRGNTLATTPQRTLRTTMVMAAPNVGTCDQLIGRARAVQRFPMITADGVVGFPAPDGTYQLGERGNSVVLRAQGAAVPPGFTIEVQMPGTSIETSRDPADVIWQRDPTSKRFYIFFKNGLSTSDSITITSNC